MNRHKTRANGSILPSIIGDFIMESDDFLTDGKTINYGFFFLISCHVETKNNNNT